LSCIRRAKHHLRVLNSAFSCVPLGEFGGGVGLRLIELAPQRTKENGKRVCKKKDLPTIIRFLFLIALENVGARLMESTNRG
jgi:hypothetical protein